MSHDLLNLLLVTRTDVKQFGVPRVAENTRARGGVEDHDVQLVQQATVEQALECGRAQRCHQGHRFFGHHLVQTGLEAVKGVGVVQRDQLYPPTADTPLAVDLVKGRCEALVEFTGVRRGQHGERPDLGDHDIARLLGIDEQGKAASKGGLDQVATAHGCAIETKAKGRLDQPA